MAKSVKKQEVKPTGLLYWAEWLLELDNHLPGIILRGFAALKTFLFWVIPL